MARLIDEFMAQVDARSERGLGASTGRLMERFGWSARDVARRFGISERTARRWRQQDRVPAKRREDWNREVRSEARARTQRNIGRRGIRNMTVTGTYRVSKSRYKATASAPVRIMNGGDKISPAQMREVFAAVDAGDMDAADALLNEALAELYEAPGLVMEDVDSLDWSI